MTEQGCACCPALEGQDPCNALVAGVFPAIVLVVIGGIFTHVILKYLPETRTFIPKWAQFLVRFVVQVAVGYMIQNYGCVRNMWKVPTTNGILASIFFMVFAPLLLPIVLRAL
ncbi:MAG: hypothetical protein H6850_01750 [Alphaproteobacteria bacterium]|nr:MAG: hypothetical protein H6850_01750 [Alphaproteobacteria bacterium]